MNVDPVLDRPPRSSAPDANCWFPRSERIRDIGDLAACGVLLGAEFVAFLHAPAWFHVIPLFR